MKEQVVTSRAGVMAGRGANASKNRASVVQNPARRERSGVSSKGTLGETLRQALGYLPFVMKLLVVVLCCVLVFALYRMATSAAFFQLQALDVAGTSRASIEEIKTVVRHQAARTGVWRADLNEIKRDVERLPWVRAAIVARVLPDGVRVRVTEREPRAVAHLASGKFVWVDDEAVMLGTLTPTDQMPAFILRGLDEADTDAARAANRERLQKYLEMMNEWDAANLSNRVSEVNLNDVHDARAQLAGDDAEIEVRLGGKEFGRRLKSALDVLDEQRRSPRGRQITRLDATLDHRVIVGFNPKANAGEEGESSGSGSNASDALKERAAATNARHQSSDKHANVKREAKPDKSARAAKAAHHDKNERAAKNVKDETRTKTRPRRVA